MVYTRTNTYGLPPPPPFPHSKNLKPAEVEQLYAQHIMGAHAVAVTFCEDVGIIAHIALGGECARDASTRAEQEAAVLGALRAALTPDFAYATPSRVSLYPVLPTSPAGKILYGDMK